MIGKRSDDGVVLPRRLWIRLFKTGHSERLDEEGKRRKVQRLLADYKSPAVTVPKRAGSEACRE